MALTLEERKEKARLRAKEYYKKNREKVLERQKNYVREKYHNDEEFRKKVLERHKIYEQNNLERVRKIKRESQRKYYEKNKEYYKNYYREKGYYYYKEKIDNLYGVLNNTVDILKDMVDTIIYDPNTKIDIDDLNKIIDMIKESI